jgi:hypothetical protein
MNCPETTETEAYAVIRERYLRDPLHIRLGGLAANLARVQSFSNHDEHSKAIHYLLSESQFFIEWTAPDASLALQVKLVELQRLLASWRLEWIDIWNDLERRIAVASEAGAWSQIILDSSGLLNPRTA